MSVYMFAYIIISVHLNWFIDVALLNIEDYHAQQPHLKLFRRKKIPSATLNFEFYFFICNFG